MGSSDSLIRIAIAIVIAILYFSGIITATTATNGWFYVTSVKTTLLNHTINPTLL